MPTSNIIQRVYATVPTKALLLSGELKRKLAIDNRWIKIRVGVLCALTPDSTSNLTAASLRLGLCTDYYGNDNLGPNSYYIGACFTGLAVPTSETILTYNAGGGNPYYTCNAAGQLYKRIGDTTVALTNFNPVVYLPTAYTGLYRRRCPIYIDITRTLGGSGACTLTAYAPTAAMAQNNDVPPALFMEGLDLKTTPAFHTVAMAVVSTIATTISEMLGPLNTLCITWQNGRFPLEISAMGASVHYGNDVYTDVSGGCDETFDTYSTGTDPVISGVLNAGTYWGGPIILSGSYGNTSPQVGYGGTSTGMPYDTFTSYGTGTISSGSTINAGNGWQGAAYVV